MTWSYSIDKFATMLNAQPPGDSTKVRSISTDTRTLQDGDVFFALKGERFDGEDYLAEAFAKGAVAAVCTEEFPPEVSIVVADPLKALQLFAARHRRLHDIPVLAITGSCGKTTSKDLVAAVLETRFSVVKTQGNLNNEIGCPLSVLQIDGATECAVFELGANHTGEIAGLCAIAKPSEAAITMIGWSHLEGFGGLEDVARAKGEILQDLPGDGTFYVNAGDELCLQLSRSFPGCKVYYGHEGSAPGRAHGDPPLDVTLDSWTRDSAGDIRMEIDPIGALTLPVYSRAHLDNILLAVAVGLRHGVSEFQTPLQWACAEGGRMKRVRLGPLEIIDDTYNSNPSSVAAALEALSQWPTRGRRLAALGEMLELGDAAEDWHREMGALAAKAGVSHLFTRGPHANLVAESARAAGVEHAQAIDDHDEMAQALGECAQSGDILLVKGSRGMAMERVIDGLRTRYSPGRNEESRE